MVNKAGLLYSPNPLRRCVSLIYLRFFSSSHSALPLSPSLSLSLLNLFLLPFLSLSLSVPFLFHSLSLSIYHPLNIFLSLSISLFSPAPLPPFHLLPPSLPSSIFLSLTLYSPSLSPPSISPFFSFFLPPSTFPLSLSLSLSVSPSASGG